MGKRQGRVNVDSLELRSERLGPLPIIYHFIDRLDLESILDRFVPTADGRVKLPYSRALGVFLRSVLVEREPIYRQQEMVSAFAPEQFGLLPGLVGHVGDDAIGRALGRLFDADRGALLTEVVIAATNTFGVKLDELHNDSTTVRFCGQYKTAKGRSIRGKTAPFITYGYSKDLRPAVDAVAKAGPRLARNPHWSLSCATLICGLVIAELSPRRRAECEPGIRIEVHSVPMTALHESTSALQPSSRTASTRA